MPFSQATIVNVAPPQVSGVLLCITIIGIPLGLANFKMVPISLFPLGKEIVPTHAVSSTSGTVVGPQP